MSQQEQSHKSIGFYPVPKTASLIISTDERIVTAEELVSVAMHLSINNPERKLQYWIRIEGE